MKTVCKINKCNGCMACVECCPKNCITIIDKIDTFNAVIDKFTCIECKLCEKICPNNIIPKQREPIKWKQGWTTTEIRNNSTSGGIAATITKNFIQSGGYVASCLFKNGQFIFELTNDLKVAKRFAGSKYVKSNPIGIYEKIKERLKTDTVLFIGLPCQVAALKNYLKDHENLYTIDLICHGTPSVKLLEKYLFEINYNLEEVKDIQFRIKTDMGLHLNRKKITLPRVMDEYTCTFLESINYTENCYSCQFARLERVADITLGDSWGTEYLLQEKNGVSLILIQTEKGKKLINIPEIELKNVDLENAIKNNHQLSQPSVLTDKRKKFLKMINDGKSFKYATLLVLPKTFIKQKIKLILIKLKLIKNDN